MKTYIDNKSAVRPSRGTLLIGTLLKRATQVMLVLLVSQVSLTADDTEVFFASDSAINPNVLFIMDNSKSMGLEENKINGKLRIDIMKDALSAVLGSDEVNNLNVGISNYGYTTPWKSDHGNGIKFPVLPLNSLVKPVIESALTDKDGNIQWRHHRQPAPAGNGQSASFNPIVDNFDTVTVRQYLVEVAKSWGSNGNTPIVEALYEAALYFRGSAIHWKDYGGYGGRREYLAAAHPATYAYPENVFHASAKYPQSEYPFIPQWYADHLSSSWVQRSVQDNGPQFPNGSSFSRYGSYLRYFKHLSERWYVGWIGCPSNTGDINNNGVDDGLLADGRREYDPEPLRNVGPSTRYNCRIMRNDFLKFLANNIVGGWEWPDLMTSIAADEADNNRVYWETDYRVDRAIRVMKNGTPNSTPNINAQLEAIARPDSAEYPRQIDGNYLTSLHFAEFPRCRVIKERRCGNNGDIFGTDQSYDERKLNYLCTSNNSEDCRAWDFEQCAAGVQEYIVNEVICDFDQNVSHYPDPNYISPIVGDCQSNYIVLMSDGKPEYSKSYDQNPVVENPAVKPHIRGKVKSLLGIARCDDDPYFSAGTCGPQLTEYLATHDNMPDDAIAKGNQFIKTMVIGFSDTVAGDSNTTDYLESLVTFDDDPETTAREGFFIATDEVGLVKAFTDALNGIKAVARSQASPGYSVNVKSGLEHEDDIYIPVFDKKTTTSWAGNLKKFKLVPVGGSRHIRGKGDAAGTVSSDDAMTELGLFRDEAWDFWSNSPTADGNVVEEGGVASLLTRPNSRRLFSDITTDKRLWKEENKLRKRNNNITNEMLNASTTAERKALIQYIRGWKNGVGGNTDAARKHMGDMLHSEPVVVTFPELNGVKQQFIFAATNEGYLHAFDTTTGEENFAFMPKQLLRNIKRQRIGSVASDEEHVYGIDGALTFIKEGSDVYLYFGLRRGGKAYYALKISQRSNGKLYPRVLWKIDGETDNNFQQLGQSWSAPYIANVLHSGVKKTVVVFTGGNDTKFDYGRGSSYSPSSVMVDKTADTGNDIYIVNAKTGERLWSMRETMGNSDVVHALPGGARLLDTNKNGLLDRLYFADTGGNVWRLDLHENLSDPSKSKLTKLASLASKEDGAYEGRKLYVEPDIAQLTDNGRVIYTISIGSGLRAHPLNKAINDHMFVLLDKSPHTALTDAYETIYIDDLAKVTMSTTTTTVEGNISNSKTITKDSNFEGKKITQVENKRGWYVEFNDDGEKVLSSATTFDGSVIFTTLTPEVLTSSAIGTSCEAPATQGRIYALDILTGEASMDLERDTDVDDNDAFTLISANEIPGKPQRIFNSLECSNGSCKHEVDLRIGKKNSEVSITDVSEIESIYWNVSE